MLLSIDEVFYKEHMKLVSSLFLHTLSYNKRKKTHEMLE